MAQLVSGINDCRGTGRGNGARIEHLQHRHRIEVITPGINEIITTFKYTADQECQDVVVKPGVVMIGAFRKHPSSLTAYLSPWHQKRHAQFGYSSVLRLPLLTPEVGESLLSRNLVCFGI